MPSGYGVQWTGEARAVLAVVNVVAGDFADRLTDEVDDVADDPQLLANVSDPTGGRPVAYTFEWYAYAVTVTVRVSDRMQLIYVDRVTVETRVGGINPYA